MITTTEKHGLRKKLLDACIEKQQFLIDDFKGRITALTEAQGIGNEESYDNDIVADNSARTSEINELNKLLEFANDELRVLQSIKRTEHIIREQVAAGAIVVTNRCTFFISASLENFQVDGHSYVGISTSSPIYHAMEGRTKGDAFTFRKVEYKIKEVI